MVIHVHQDNRIMKSMKAGMDNEDILMPFLQLLGWVDSAKITPVAFRPLIPDLWRISTNYWLALLFKFYNLKADDAFGDLEQFFFIFVIHPLQLHPSFLTHMSSSCYDHAGKFPENPSQQVGFFGY